MTRPRRLRAHPEGVQLSLCQVKAKLNRPVRQPCQVARPLPVAVLLRDGDQGAAVRPMPVEAIATEAGADLVRLGPVLRLAAPDAEQPEQQTLVGDTVEVVQLWRGLQVVALRVELVGAYP